MVSKNIVLTQEDVDNINDCIERTKAMWEPGKDLWPFVLKDIVDQWEKSIALRNDTAIIDVGSKYNELIFAVHSKYPGESRHDTALRYIRRMEEPSATNSASRVVNSSKISKHKN